MITADDKKKLAEWLVFNLQLTGKSNVELIVNHIDHYFSSPQAEGMAGEETQEMMWMKIRDIINQGEAEGEWMHVSTILKLRTRFNLTRKK